jgi:N utilization substance protein A
MISKGFYETLEEIANERNLEIEDIKTIVQTALIKACQLEDYVGDISVEFNDELKKIRIFETLTVVEQVEEEGPVGQVTLEDAKEIRERVKVGSIIKREIPFTAIERKGASRFKQILVQGLKELGGAKATEYFKSVEGEILTATISSVLDNFLVLDLGMNVQTRMPLTESLPGETYKEGDQIKVCITKVEETGRGPKVYVSRSSRDIIKRFFEMYIPEIADGTVEIIALAREPGSRSKVGIKSNDPHVDGKGSCVGMGGKRIKKINAALNGEHIDIFSWSDNPVILIAESLTPAKVLSVMVDEASHKSTVIVEDDQFSLAIGRGGQNVRLASQATGWKIDIKDETTAYREGIHFTPNNIFS